MANWATNFGHPNRQNGHCGFFVRNYEHLSKPPTNLKIDEGFMEWLIDTLARLLTCGLHGMRGTER